MKGRKESKEVNQSCSYRANSPRLFPHLFGLGLASTPHAYLNGWTWDLQVYPRLGLGFQTWTSLLLSLKEHPSSKERIEATCIVSLLVKLWRNLKEKDMEVSDLTKRFELLQFLEEDKWYRYKKIEPNPLVLPKVSILSIPPQNK